MNYKDLESEFSDYSKLVQLIEEYDMVTGADIATGILGVTRSIDLLKKAKEIAENTNNIEIKEIIVELREQLADTKILLVDTKEELAQLKEELAQLKSPEWKLIFDTDHRAYYASEDTDKKNPYCPTCWDNNKEKHILTLFRISSGFDYGYYHKCQKCDFGNTHIPYEDIENK